MKYVLTYESPADLDMDAVMAHVDAHRARWQEYQEQGTLLLIGPFADPREGAMGVFTTQEAAEDFAIGDPFVLNGLVADWRITGWNEVLLEPI
ncbi:MAG: YciI family protein [Acidimicrobiales bacterium]